MSFRDYIPTRLSAFLAWSFPLKLAISGAAGLLGTAGVLGVLSEYATYSYAIYFGIRPPLEGIPYLQAAVSLGSFMVLTAMAMIFAGVVVALRQLGHLLGRLENLRQLAADVPLTLRGQLVFSFFASACVFLLFSALSAISGTLRDDLVKLTGIAGYIFIAWLVMLRPSTVPWIALMATVLFLCVCAFLLFTPTTYAKFLRAVGYGGGLPITIEVQTEQNPATTNTGFLVLRTTEALIVYDASMTRFVEIPRSKATRISYAIPSGLNASGFQLPPTASATK